MTTFSFKGSDGTTYSTNVPIYDVTTGGLLIANPNGTIMSTTGAKITKTAKTLVAGTQQQVVAANVNRVALTIQCASGDVTFDETGATLTASGIDKGTLYIPPGNNTPYIPPVATQAAITAMTGTGQIVVITEYSR